MSALNDELIETTRENGDEELDIASETFNPLRALYEKDFRVTQRTPKVIYQNLAAFDSALKKFGIWNLNKSNKPKPAEQQSDAKASSSKQTSLETTRRFEPHQMAVKGTVKKRHQRNLYTHMDNMQGPLSALKNCLSMHCQGQRVCVQVRKEQGVRGTIEGELIAFDKQWNLLLREVVEVWQRRKYNYGAQNICHSEPQDCSVQLRELGIELPAVQVKSLNRKNVELRRELPQLLVRGEQVVLISWLS